MPRALRRAAFWPPSARFRSVPLARLAGGGWGRSERAVPAPPSAPATIAGQIVLSGALANVRRGFVTVSAWPAGAARRADGQPLLSRAYAIGDPDWSQADGVLMRYFGLCDADRAGDPA